jgi:hypothetical protein
MQIRKSGQKRLKLVMTKCRIADPHDVSKDILDHRELCRKNWPPSKSVDRVHAAISSAGAKAQRSLSHRRPHDRPMIKRVCAFGRPIPRDNRHSERWRPGEAAARPDWVTAPQGQTGATADGLPVRLRLAILGVTIPDITPEMRACATFRLGGLRPMKRSSRVAANRMFYRQTCRKDAVEHHAGPEKTPVKKAAERPGRDDTVG